MTSNRPLSPMCQPPLLCRESKIIASNYAPSPLCLAAINSREDLAKELNVDIKSLDLVELTDTPCRSDGNYNQCILSTMVSSKVEQRRP
eukprot:scaffold2619_cov162-Skeletonema_marinoi.AAC.6